MSILTPGGSAKKSVEGWQCCVYTPSHSTHKSELKKKIKNLGQGKNKKSPKDLLLGTVFIS